MKQHREQFSYHAFTVQIILVHYTVDDFVADVKPAMADAFDDSPVVIAELPHIKLFGKWSSEDVNHSDMSLAVSLIAHLLQIYLYCCFLIMVLLRLWLN